MRDEAKSVKTSKHQCNAEPGSMNFRANYTCPKPEPYCTVLHCPIARFENTISPIHGHSIRLNKGNFCCYPEKAGWIRSFVILWYCMKWNASISMRFLHWLIASIDVVLRITMRRGCSASCTVCTVLSNGPKNSQICCITRWLESVIEFLQYYTVFLWWATAMLILSPDP